MYVWRRLRNPVQFQGNLSNRNYFEGWYYKQVGATGRHKLAVIPAVALSEKESFAFIQLFDGTSGESHYVKYPLSEFKAAKDRFHIRVGDSTFTLGEVNLDIDDKVKASGILRYSGHTLYRSPPFHRGVMGWFGYVPFMQTYHGLISLDHEVHGAVDLNGRTLDFKGGRGYIEKDWGRSFPEAWIWMQCNSFNEPGTSLMFSSAVIPWMGLSFVGHLCVLLLGGETLNLSTYNGGRIRVLDTQEDSLSLKVETRRHTLEIEASRLSSTDLKSPIRGEMTGRTVESLDAVIEARLTMKTGHGEKELFSGTGRHAGLEIMDSEQKLARKLGLTP